MKSFVDTAQILSVGYEMSGSATTAAFGILAVTAPLAFGVALVRHAGGARHPFAVILQILVVMFALKYYAAITNTVADIGNQAAAAVGKAGKFEQLMERYANDADLQFKPNPGAANQSAWDRAVDVVGSFGAGLLSGILAVLGMIAVLVALDLYAIVQAVLYGVLVAVGPIVIAVCIIPGAQQVFGKWLSALFELAMWPVIGSIVFEMIGASLLKLNDDATQIGSTNFITKFVANVAMVFCVCLVPKIAARLVGSGFGALGDMMMNAAMGPATSMATGAASLSSALAGKGYESLGNASSAVAAAANAPRLYQPPANGGPKGGMAMGSSISELEMMPAQGPGAARGPESFDHGDAKTEPNLMQQAAAPVDKAAAVGQPQMDSSNFQGVEAERWGGFEGFGGNNGAAPLRASVAPPSGSPGPSDAPGQRAVSLHAVAERNAEFRRMFPDGQMKDGVFYSPDKVAEFKRQGKW